MLVTGRVQVGVIQGLDLEEHCQEKGDKRSKQLHMVEERHGQHAVRPTLGQELHFHGSMSAID